MTFQISGFHFQKLLLVLSEEEMSWRQHELTTAGPRLGIAQVLGLLFWKQFSFTAPPDLRGFFHLFLNQK